MLQNNTFLIDCMEKMKTTPDKYHDLAICDIPYGINVGKMPYLSETKNSAKQKNGTRSRIKSKRVYTEKEWDEATPPQEYFNELRRVSKHQIIFGAQYTDWEGLGTGSIKWNKGMSEKVSFSTYEYAYCSMIDREITIDLLWAGLAQAANLKDPMRQQGNKKLNEKRIHPTHKPILLYIRLLMEFAKPGMKILDTHLGSGSSRIAADRFGCHFEGYEIDPEYFALEEKRWNTYKSQLLLF
jgi:site-specific DNA-methyltransferase (adenine-specific)